MLVCVAACSIWRICSCARACVVGDCGVCCGRRVARCGGLSRSARLPSRWAVQGRLQSSSVACTLLCLLDEHTLQCTHTIATNRAFVISLRSPREVHPFGPLLSCEAGYFVSGKTTRVKQLLDGKKASKGGKIPHIPPPPHPLSPSHPPTLPPPPPKQCGEAR